MSKHFKISLISIFIIIILFFVVLLTTTATSNEPTEEYGSLKFKWTTQDLFDIYKKNYEKKIGTKWGVFGPDKYCDYFGLWFPKTGFGIAFIKKCKSISEVKKQPF